MSQSDPDEGTGGRSARVSWEVRPAHVVAGVLLAVAILAPLLVATYAKAAPSWSGFPFFYWWQLLLVPICAALSAVAYVLVTGAERKRRREHGLSERGGDTAGTRAAAGHAATEEDAR